MRREIPHSLKFRSLSRKLLQWYNRLLDVLQKTKQANWSISRNSHGEKGRRTTNGLSDRY